MKRLIVIAALFAATTATAQIKFSADFECGSMEKVELVSQENKNGTESYTYDFFSRFDPANPARPTLAPSARWYYFCMEGVKGKEVILNVKNSDARRPFYSYDNQNWTRFSETESPDEKTIIKTYSQDKVWIAYYVPYTYSRLLGKIQEWVQNPWVDLSSIGTSEHCRNMPLLIITNKNGKKDKKIVYIHGRVHTSETPGTWHLERMIDVLASDTPYANALRENVEYYILPFTNPDGVVEGNSRSNSSGVNMEVNWDDPEEVTTKEVKNMRAFLQGLLKEKGVDVFLNMHSQSMHQATYWVHTAETSSDKFYKDLMLLANLTINDNPYFAKGDLCFSKMGSRYCEGWFWNNSGEKTVAVTFETPYTYYSQNKAGEWVTVENLQKFADYNVLALGDYLQEGAPYRILLEEPAKKCGFETMTDHSKFYFGNSYLKATGKNAKVKYVFNGKKEGVGLPAGKYEVYKWAAGDNLKKSNEGENEWVKIGEISHKGGKKIKYTHKASQGELVDQILLKKAE